MTRPIALAVRSVLQVLVLGVGVDRGHQTLLDPHRLVQRLGHRGEAVRGARRVRDDVVLGRVVRVVVDAHDDGDVLVLRRRRDDHLLGAVVQVHLGLVAVGEEPGGLDHDVRAQIAPRQLGGVTFGECLHGLAAHGDLVGGGLHLVRQAAQDAVVLQQVGERGVVGQVVDADDLDVRAGGEHRPEEVAADTAEAVDANPDGHRISSY
jgi:hypothetical protein